jgi:hypothetical protein
MSTARLGLSEFTKLASIAAMRRQALDGEPITAGLMVFFSYGKSDRALDVPLSRNDCLLLAEKALEAVRMIDAQEARS